MTNSENNSLFKQPSAWLPLLMSFAALAMILILRGDQRFGIVQ